LEQTLFKMIVYRIRDVSETDQNRGLVVIGIAEARTVFVSRLLVNDSLHSGEVLRSLVHIYAFYGLEQDYQRIFIRYKRCSLLSVDLKRVAVRRTFI